ncbi:MAG: hypothetical protein GY906_20705 [bacterium]|nr:hypothetical protein [bacterium]
MLGCLGYALIAAGVLLALVLASYGRESASFGVVPIFLVCGAILVISEKLVRRSVAADRNDHEHRSKEIEARVRAEAAEVSQADAARELAVAAKSAPPARSVAFTCPNCGASGRTPAGSTIGECDYCNSAIDLEYDKER